MRIAAVLTTGLLVATSLSACSGHDLTCVPADTSGGGGSVTVPVIAVGTSADDALDQLRSAGLEGCTLEVDFAHYATGTDPAGGTTVARGSRVTLEIGDG